jgi:hypothetical protein
MERVLSCLNRPSQPALEDHGSKERVSGHWTHALLPRKHAVQMPARLGKEHILDAVLAGDVHQSTGLVSVWQPLIDDGKSSEQMNARAADQSRVAMKNAIACHEHGEDDGETGSESPGEAPLPFAPAHNDGHDERPTLVPASRAEARAGLPDQDRMVSQAAINVNSTKRGSL